MNSHSPGGLRPEESSPSKPPEELQASRRPQSLVLNFLGIYYRTRSCAVYAGSVIEVFDRLGVKEHAVRSALTRMVKRGLLEKHRDGRKVYFAPTERAATILEDGHRRIWERGAMNSSWDGTWTLVAFSLPDDRRDQRHLLRQELVWAGFGLLQHGLWAHPGATDVAGILEKLSLYEHVTVMSAKAQSPTDAEQLVAEVFDLESIAKRYHDFLSVWSSDEPVPDAADDLVRQIFLHTDWLALIRHDPRLPAVLVPDDWPVLLAERTFHDLATQFATPAARIVRESVEELPIAE